MMKMSKRERDEPSGRLHHAGRVKRYVNRIPAARYERELGDKKKYQKKNERECE